MLSNSKVAMFPHDMTLLQSPLHGALKRHQRSFPTFPFKGACQKTKGLISLTSPNPGGLCVYFRGLQLSPVLLLDPSLDELPTLFCSFPLVVLLYHYSITAKCCREEVKRSLKARFHESVNLFLNLLSYLLWLAGFFLFFFVMTGEYVYCVFSLQR